MHKETGDEVHTITPRGGEWFFKLMVEDKSNAHIRVIDDADNQYLLQIE